MLITFLEKHRHELALLENGSQLTYCELRNRIIQIADALKNLDIKVGTRIGICADSSIDYIAVLYAIIYYGAVAVLLNSRLPGAQIQKSADFVNCKLIITTKSWKKKFIHAQRIDQLTSGKILPDNKMNTTTINQEASILFTSGSSEKPKAVLHTFGSHYYNALGSNENLMLRPGERWLLSLPLYHVAGLAICMRALLSGATVVIPDKEIALEKTIKNHAITHLSLVPTQLFRLLSRGDFTKTQSLKAILLGGSPIFPSLIKKAMQIDLPLYTSYGSTEMASQITTTTPDACYEELITAGYPLKYREIKIGDKGEICCKGATLAKGYVEHAGVRPIGDDSGWFRTGDRGVFDRSGRLIILGRMDKMFISGGENVYPEEIERVLSEFEGVEEAVVVPVSDDEFGERPAAFIRWRGKSAADYKNLQAFVRASLPGYLQPVKWFNWPYMDGDAKPNYQALKKIALNNFPDFLP